MVTVHNNQGEHHENSNNVHIGSGRMYGDGGSNTSVVDWDGGHT